MVVYEVYKQALIHRGSEIEFLYSEISNPFDGQVLGWGINSEWVHEFDGEDQGEFGNETATNETPTDQTPDNDLIETDTEGVDTEMVTLWSNIVNTKVYEADIEAVGNESTENESVPEPADDDRVGNESGN
jgi:hypothetical protein